MNHDIEITQLDLVAGGNVIRQGHHFTLDFTPRGENGDVIALTGKDIYAVFYDKNGIRYEGAASYISSDAVIRVEITENIGHGTMWIEFTATDPNDAAYKKKFPARENNARISITPSTDDLSFVGVKSITVEQLRNEQMVAQQEFEADVLPRVETVEGKQAQLEANYEAAVGALTEDSEVILARGDKPTLGARLDDTAVKLADKVGGMRKLEPEEFSDEAMALVTGNGTVNVLSIPQDQSVTPNKTTFAQGSKNLFNKDTAATGKRVAGGAVVDDAAYALSDFIPIAGGTTIKRNVLAEINIYDSSQAYLTIYPNNTEAITLDSRTAYMRIAVALTRLDTLQVELGSVSTAYESAGKLRIPDLELPDNAIKTSTLQDNIITRAKILNGEITKEKIAKEAVTNDILAPNAVTADKAAFLTKSKNIFNKDNVNVNKRANNTTGVLEDFADYVTSYMIPVDSNATYARNKNAAIAQYDVNQAFVTNLPANTTAFTTHVNTRFIRIGVSTSNAPLLQVEKGSVNTPYESYSKLGLPGLEISESAVPKATTDKAESEFYSRNEAISRKFPSNLVTLIGAKDDETVNTINLSTPTHIKDYSRRWANDAYGYTLSGTGSPQFIATRNTPLTIPKTAAVGMAIWVDDPSKVTKITINLTFADKAVIWNKAKSTFRKGWNIIRISSVTMKANVPVDATYLDDWGTQLSVVKIFPTFSAESKITIGKVWLECPPKAQILFINDGGYKRFKDLGYPDLKARNFPVTWALNPNRLGMHVGTQAERMTEAEVMELALDGNSYFSFHTWDSQTQATATEYEVREDALRCVRWLRARGLITNDVMRGAVVQNNAPNWQGMVGVVQASRTWNAARGFETFPFIDRWNIPTDGIHSMIQPTYNTTDDHFRILKETHGLFVAYVHGIDPTYSGDITQEGWDYFVSKIDEGLNEGWLEGVSYEMLRNRMSLTQEIEDELAVINATRK